MFYIVDTKQSHTVIKSGFKTASQANNWAKKNLPREEVKLWKSGYSPDDYFRFRYFIWMK